MTACVNKKSKRVAAVVTASLVGALSIGAPAVALADTNIETLTAGDVEDVARGSISGYTDQDGDAVESTEFVANGKSQYIVPTEVTSELGHKSEVDTSGNFKVNYYKVDDNGSETATWAPNQKLAWISNPSAIKDAGVYYVAVASSKGANINQHVALKFTIVNQSLEGATIVGATKEDAELVYNGDVQSFAGSKLNVLLNGKLLKHKTDYTVTIRLKSDTGNSKNHPAKEAADYVAKLTGQGVYKGSVVEVPFTINKLDLSKANIDVSDLVAVVGTELPTTINSVNGSNVATGYISDLQAKYVDSYPSKDVKGAYTLRISEKDPDSNKNIEGSKDLTVVRYQAEAYFEYNNTTWKSSVESFDPSLVKVYTNNTDYKKLEFDIAYVNTDTGKAVAAEDIKAPGNYKATVTVKDSTYSYGGSQTVTFSVAASVIKVDDIYITYDGKAIDDSFSKIYSGSDYAEKLGVRAFYKGEEVDSSNLKLEITDSKGDVVDKIVDAGDYTVKAKAADGTMYQIQAGDDDVKIAIVPVKLSANSGDNAVIRLAGAPVLVGMKDTYAYTGEAVVPTFEYDLIDDEGENWIALPETSYKVKYEIQANGVWKKVDNAVKPGTYRAVLSDNAKDGNYKVVATVPFSISQKKVFLDVPNNEWFSEAVYSAQSLGYINGYGDGKFFGPNDTITRAQVAVVLYNMADLNKNFDSDDFKYDADKYYETGFSDVDGHAYYANAIAWAKTSGIVNGYADGTFRPDATISREEFCGMLSNYALKNGDDVKGADQKVLDSFSDASSVSDWSKAAMAWAVDNGVMHGYADGSLKPAGTITRAQVAAMAVNYQPANPDIIA